MPYVKEDKGDIQEMFSWYQEARMKIEREKMANFKDAHDLKMTHILLNNVSWSHKHYRYCLCLCSAGDALQRPIGTQCERTSSVKYAYYLSRANIK